MSAAPEITDEMLRAAVKAMGPDRIQGFATPRNDKRTEWGAPYYIRDVYRKAGEQELWRGDDGDEMHERCEMERLRIGFLAAFAVGPKGDRA